MQDDLKFVAVGHVDHGKSTMIGRLLYDTNSLPPDKMEEVRQMSEEADGVPEFAFVMDHLEEERVNRVTIDTAQIFFKTAKRDYVIIDAPGHKQFLKNMITGSTQAEAALLLVDAVEGLREQTHRHAYMLSLLGIKQLMVVINKMDLVDYDQSRFDEVRTDITDRLAEFDLHPLMVIPISARLGENITSPSDKMTWHHGKTLLAGLDELEPTPSLEKGPLRLPVQDIYEQNGRKIIVGRIASGTLKSNQEIIFQPLGRTATVETIEVFGDSKDHAGAGESIGITIRDAADIRGIRRGQTICAISPSPQLSNTIVATVFWMSGEPLRKGEQIELKCATQQMMCKVKKIAGRMNSSTLEVIESDAEQLCETEVAMLTLKAGDCLCMDSFESIPEMGRFVLMRDTDTVAGGVVH